MLNISQIIKQKIVKNVFVYTSSNIIIQAIPFFFIPVLTRYMTPEDYGIMSTFQVLSAVAVVFINLETHGALAVTFFRVNKKDFKIYLGNVVYLLCTNFIVIFIIAYLAKSLISNLIKFPEKWLMIAVVFALSQVIITFLLTLWLIKQSSFPYGMLQIAHSVLNVILSLIFVVAMGWRWQGKLTSDILSSMLFCFIAVFILNRKQYISFSFNKKYIIDAFCFGSSLIPHALFAWVIAYSDRFFINALVDVSATGIYTIGYQLGGIITLLAASFNKAWAPFLFKNLKQSSYVAKLKIVKLTYLYGVCLVMCAFLLSFAASFVCRFWVGENFYYAYKYVFLLAIGNAFYGMYLMVVNYIFYVKKQYILAFTTLLSGCLNIVLNYFLIKKYGVIGAAQATAITYFVNFLFAWRWSAKVYKMPWIFWKSQETI